MRTLPTGLLDQLVHAYGRDLGEATEVFTGDESVGWRLPSDGEDLFVQLYPDWRTVDEIEWCHRIARSAAAEAPEVVLPRLAANGSATIGTPFGPVCVFPFVQGARADIDSPSHRTSAAEVLARIHRGIAANPSPRPPRPPSGTGAPSTLRSMTADNELPDNDLDIWERSLVGAEYPRHLIHGDFYPGNVLCGGPRVIGVLDWLEVDLDFLGQELGWAVWEFSQNATGDDLIDERAAAFVADYLAAGGPASPVEIASLVRFIRRRLRREVMREREMARLDREWDAEYMEAEIRAFHTLKTRAIERP
jgi:Ser/Thr protein kinase RdoA (MazF antagonist)